jgi:hypothetical protein
MAKLGLRANLLTKGLTQYQAYGFDSMVDFNGVPVGIGPDGTYRLFTGDTDDGAQIDARFDLPESDLGTTRNKRLRSIFLGCRATGELKITVSDDEDYSHSYVAAPRKLDKQSILKVPCGRNFNKGCYYQLRVENVDGADFDIDYIEVLPVYLTRKPGGF